MIHCILHCIIVNLSKGAFFHQWRYVNYSNMSCFLQILPKNFLLFHHFCIMVIFIPQYKHNPSSLNSLNTPFITLSSISVSVSYWRLTLIFAGLIDYFFWPIRSLSFLKVSRERDREWAISTARLRMKSASWREFYANKLGA